MGIPQIIEFLKILLPRLFLVALAFAFSSAFFLFMPDNVLDFLYVLHFSDTNRSWIGGTLIASSGILLALFCLYIPRPLQRYFEERRNRSRRQQRLHQLTPRERAILRKYFTEDTRTQNLSLRNGDARGLVTEGILFCPHNSIGNESSMPHNIRSWAWDYLKKHPELLKD